jgi:hypothetical protein
MVCFPYCKDNIYIITTINKQRFTFIGGNIVKNIGIREENRYIVQKIKKYGGMIPFLHCLDSEPVGITVQVARGKVCFEGKVQIC